MPHLLRYLPLSVLVLSWSAFAALPASVPSYAQDPAARYVLTADLVQRRATIVDVSPAGAVTLVWAESATAQVLLPGATLAIVPPVATIPVVPPRRDLGIAAQTAARDQVSPGLLVTTDGQLIPGNVRAQQAENEEIRWSSRQFGELLIPLKQVRELLLQPGGSFSTPADRDDHVYLVNGDVASGFVASITDTVSIEQTSQSFTVPLDRIARIRLANPLQPTKGARIWLFNGSVISVQSIAVREGPESTLASPSPSPSSASPAATPIVAALSLTRGVNSGPAQEAVTRRAVFVTPLAPAPVDIALSELRAIAFDVTRLIPLSALPVARVSAQEQAGRRWVPQPIIADERLAPLGAADIELPGPMTVDWLLPADVDRFAATIELPISCRLWGDCVVSCEFVTQGEIVKPLWQERLSAARPLVVVNTPLFVSGLGGTLRIRVEEGAFGPIMDRVVIRRGLFTGRGAQSNN